MPHTGTPLMRLEPGETIHGIAHRPADGAVAVLRFGARWGFDRTPVLDRVLAERRIDSGDIITGLVEDGALAQVTAINGLDPDEAADRPTPRKRSTYDRSPMERLIPLAVDRAGLTGQMLECCAPLAVGAAGLVYGPHGSGLTRSLQAVAQAATASGEVEVIALLCRARSEEATHWRRRFPGVEVVTTPSREEGVPAEHEALAAEVVLSAAQRRTEQGRHVLLLIDSLTACWAAMLEAENADAQAEADQSAARLRMTECLQAPGWFGGEGLFGGGLGGSLTLVASAWHIAVDDEEEEERESHPYLRLVEHALGGLTWRVPLSGELAGRRLYPAIDPIRCFSSATRLCPAGLHDAAEAALRTLGSLPLIDRHAALAEALEAEPTTEAALMSLAGDAPAPPTAADLLLPLE